MTLPLNNIKVAPAFGSLYRGSKNILLSLEEKEWESIAWPLIKSWNKENNNPPSPEEELRTTFESIKKKEWQRVEEEEQKGSFTK